jgi:hypothetical protein
MKHTEFLKKCHNHWVLTRILPPRAPFKYPPVSTVHFYPHLGLDLHREIRHQELRHKQAGGQIHIPAPRLPIIEQRQGFVGRRHRRRRAGPRFAPTEKCGAAGRLSGGGEVWGKEAAEKMLEGEDLLLVEVQLEAGQVAG